MKNSSRYNRIFIYVVFLCTSAIHCVFSQNVVGRVIAGDGRPVASASVLIDTLSLSTDENGRFFADLPEGVYLVKISAQNYFTPPLVIRVPMQDTLRIVVYKDVVDLEGVVISASRSEEKRLDSPVAVQTMDERIFASAQTVSLSEGLSFSPGLRMENNCQNCGFNQVRINGLGGAYSRMLLDGRPVFGPLMGVYGLEFLPTEMMERVEVVRGGGSAVYGLGAVAGTVNIVTRTPVFPEWHVSARQSWTGGRVPESFFSGFGAWTGKEDRWGATGFGIFRRRLPFDANGDGFSERTALTTAAAGAKFRFRPRPERRFSADVYALYENRRGGSDFALQPHEARTAEALKHRAIGTSFYYENLSKNLKNRLSVYTALQYLNRESYYGNMIMVADGLDPYGQASDFSLATGAQFSRRCGRNDWALFTAGAEWNRNAVADQTGGVIVAGNPRTLGQTADNFGVYLLFEPKITSRWTLQAGLRTDFTHLNLDDGLYRFHQNRVFFAVNPRISGIYKPFVWMRVRAGYGTGFRPPQAFDEDLHLAVVAGEVWSRRLAADLRPERSHSLNAELVFTPKFGRFTTEIGLDGFFTRLQHAFVYEAAEVGVWEKRNGTGATVTGATFRALAAWTDKIWAELNFTALDARNDAPVDWGGPKPEARFLRTPGFYGAGALSAVLYKGLSLSLTVVFTGTMLAPRFSPFDAGNVPDDEPYRQLLPKQTQLLPTPMFLDVHPKMAYKTYVYRKRFYLEPNVGVFNVFNAYQRDFGYGVYRDPNYVYGPERPITPYVGLKAGWQ